MGYIWGIDWEDTKLRNLPAQDRQALLLASFELNLHYFTRNISCTPNMCLLQQFARVAEVVEHSLAAAILHLV
jgi:hypothetical protein